MLAATILALTIILLIVCHKWRLGARDIEGYWRATQDGDHIGREYNVISRGEGVQIVGRNSADGPLVSLDGDVRFLRRICVRGLANGAKNKLKCGTVDLQGRHIDWGGGYRWVREGVYHCASCIT